MMLLIDLCILDITVVLDCRHSFYISIKWKSTHSFNSLELVSWSFGVEVLRFLVFYGHGRYDNTAHTFIDFTINLSASGHG
jgi:hypothetical protein